MFILLIAPHEGGHFAFAKLFKVNSGPAKVEYVIKPSPADDAGIRPGDRIQSVDGRKLGNPTDIRNAVSNSNGSPVTVVVLKSDGHTQTLSLVPQYNDAEKRSV